MSTSPEEPALPLIIVHAEAGASARRRVSDFLEAAGARPGEVQHLLAVIEAGAVEGAHAEAAEDTQLPTGSSDEFGEGWLGAVQAVTSRLTHIADRTVRQARATAAASKSPLAVSSPPARRSSMAVDAVGEEQVHRVLEAAERIFVSRTGCTGYDRDLSEEILTVVLKAVSAEQQDSYVRQLEAFAEANGERLAKLFSRYGPGGRFEDRNLCYLTHQPESVVVCERLDVVPMRLAGVWNDEIDAELTLERFTKYWRFGL
ncbi:hypothetical protein ACIOHS_46835 [Streptomyces sp. NPDC088253]|uniref:hypothetical protein n=1 Tax=Streptomyces sp. NPDC088253 TaxID=3365846 RepID=UPI003825CD9F